MGEAVRKIIHVDMDAFYASVEQRDNPALRGKPVAVGHGARRGVVTAASYEARPFGVRSALPSVTALRRCPELIFVPPRFDVYRQVSRQVHDVFAEFTDLIEPLSLDEAYLDVTANAAGLPTAWLTAKAIRARILEVTGLTASAGVSYNKFLAKLASGKRKPNGQFAITPEEGEAFVEALPVAKFHGVGPATAARMHAAGIQTGADLKTWSLQDLQRRFGKAGGWYHAICRWWTRRPGGQSEPGEEVVRIGDHVPRGLPRPGADRSRRSGDGRRRLVVVREESGARARTVTVKIKWADFQQSTRSQSLTRPIDSRSTLHEASLGLIRSVFPPAKGVRLVGVTLSNFVVTRDVLQPDDLLAREPDASCPLSRPR